MHNAPSHVTHKKSAFQRATYITTKHFLRRGITLLVCSLFLLISTLPVSAMSKTQVNASPFTDLRPSAWYYNDVITAVNAGYIKGFPNGTFKPNHPVTCGQALATIAEAIGEDCEAKALTSHWASRYAQRYQRIATVQYEAMLDEPIDRQMLLNIIQHELRFAGLPNAEMVSDSLDLFKDVHTLKNHALVNFCYAAGIIKSSARPGERIANLDSKVTRAELCAILLRAAHFKQSPLIEDDYYLAPWKRIQNPFSEAIKDRRTTSPAILDNSKEGIRNRYIQALVEGRQRILIVYDKSKNSLNQIFGHIYNVSWTRRDLKPTNSVFDYTYRESGDFAYLEVAIQQEEVQEFYSTLERILLEIFPNGFDQLSERERVDKISDWMLDYFTPETENNLSSHYPALALPTGKAYGWAYAGIQVALFRLAELEAYSVEGNMRIPTEYDPRIPFVGDMTFTSVKIDNTTYYINMPLCDYLLKQYTTKEHYLLTKAQMDAIMDFKEY